MKRAILTVVRLGAAVFTLGCLLTLGGLWAWRSLNTPFRGYSGDAVFVEVVHGMSTAEIGALLEREGVLAEAWHLRALRLLHPGAVLQAGEYRFGRPLSSTEVFHRLRRGDIYFVTISFPEGSNIFEMARIVRESELADASDFLAQAQDPGRIRDLAPDAPSLEGFLFPSTYQFRRKATGAELCDRLVAEFRKQWNRLGSPADTARIVTVASLVEKETSVDKERPLVASVYWNRIQRDMRLDADPTVIYAALLEGRYRGTIYQSDLDRQHPYNTYRRAGLPPGPIANPGLDSLRASVHPAKTDYLFFVAKGDGSGEHRFSETMKEHTRAVVQYRNAIRTNSTRQEEATAGGNPRNR